MEWTDDGWRIAGLVDLGTSWHRARLGLEYRYRAPSSLLVQVDRPGRIRVYQSGFHVATLADGEIQGHQSIIDVSTITLLHSPVSAGLYHMRKEIHRPKIEEAREFAEFEFIALWNTHAAIANSISQDGHGGGIIIVPTNEPLPLKSLRTKYGQRSTILRAAFIGFMNARHKVGDLMARQEHGEPVTTEEHSLAELGFREAHGELVEAMRFVAQLARCDGAIVISDDLTLLGFGAEIRAKLQMNSTILDARTDEPVDVEQFGMRHRSAVNLVSQHRRYHVLVVSQDGPISAIWSKDDRVLVRTGIISLTNLNMPWA
ncbi:MAG TPA: hypothetical protein VGU20_28955 [Stellaceae bacterium]|nr:hypothetical protein [Stellaceae bacterium]